MTGGGVAMSESCTLEINTGTREIMSTVRPALNYIPPIKQGVIYAEVQGSPVMPQRVIPFTNEPSLFGVHILATAIAITQIEGGQP
jgi:hypothetical protein